MKEELLEKISEYTKSAGNVVVEAAHIYADQEPNGEHSAGAIVASKVLQRVYSSTQRLLFIDDFHPQQFLLNVDSYHAWLASYGFVVDQTVFESELVPEAHLLLAKIKDVVVSKKKLSYSKDNSSSVGLWTPRGKVPLITQGGKPSCYLLDAALYTKKAGIGDLALTILPESYLDQQLKTLAVLRRVGHTSLIINMFFDPLNPLENLSVQFYGDEG